MLNDPVTRKTQEHNKTYTEIQLIKQDGNSGEFWLIENVILDKKFR